MMEKPYLNLILYCEVTVLGWHWAVAETALLERHIPMLQCMVVCQAGESARTLVGTHQVARIHSDTHRGV